MMDRRQIHRVVAVQPLQTGHEGRRHALVAVGEGASLVSRR